MKFCHPKLYILYRGLQMYLKQY